MHNNSFQPDFRQKNGAGFICAISLFHVTEQANHCRSDAI